MKKIILSVFVSLLFLVVTVNVYATNTPFITICHHTPGNNVTLSFQNVQSYLGHLGTPHNVQTYDTIGACQNPTPTPTVIPTSTPTPTTIPSPTPTIDPCLLTVAYTRFDINPCITPSPEVTVTPSPQPTQVPGGFTEANHEQAKDAPMCSNLRPTMINDVWYSDYKVSGEEASLVLHWGGNSNYPSVNIAYGENINEWRYAVLNIPNNGQFTIGGLKPRQTYWFQVAYVLGCSVGPYSRPIDP